MKRMTRGGAVAIALLSAACTDTTSPSDADLLLADAFLSVPAGFSTTTNSFNGDGTEGAFMPRMDGRGGNGGGPRGEGGAGLMGGLSPHFLGGIGFGRGFGHGPFRFGPLSSDCAFSSSTGRVTCPAVTERGLTVTRSFSFRTAGGTAQSAPDSTTNSINSQIELAGNVTRRDSATSVVKHSSNQTVAGLAAGSTQRTVNGTSRGEEASTGTRDGSAFTSTRLVGDTITGVIVPVQDGRPTYPTAGTVVRSMKATVSIAGATPTTKNRREVITYNGSATATLVVTQDGTTKTCQLPLPRGKPICS